MLQSKRKVTSFGWNKDLMVHFVETKTVSWSKMSVAIFYMRRDRKI
jgi:hypothetical protein